MSREMRIIWLHNRLSTNDKASMKEYTQKFGISSRQALRDFRYLRINLGAPLKYSRKRGKYFYSESYRLPSLFEDSMKSQMIAEDRVSFTLLKAVERKKAVRLVLRGGSEFLFHPACFDQRHEVFYGIHEDGHLCIIRTDTVETARVSSIHYVEEPMLWNRVVPREAEFKEVTFELDSKLQTYHFFQFGDLIMFIASNEAIRIVAPDDVIDRLRVVTNILEKVLSD